MIVAGGQDRWINEKQAGYSKPRFSKGFHLLLSYSTISAGSLQDDRKAADSDYYGSLAQFYD